MGISLFVYIYIYIYVCMYVKLILIISFAILIDKEWSIALIERFYSS